MKTLLPKTHLACGTDDLRPIMSHVFIHEGNAVATDAHILVIQNLESCTSFKKEFIDQLEGKLIHRLVWQQCFNAEALFIKDGKLLCIKKGLRTYYDIETQENARRYPDYKNVLPKLKDAKAIQRVSFNAFMLSKIQTIFDCINLNLEFIDAHKAISVTPGQADYNQKALIMPVLNSDFIDR